MKKILALMTLLMLTMQSVYADPAVGNGATINGTTPKLTGVQIGSVSGTVGSGDALLNLSGGATQLRPASSTQPFTVYNAAGTIANFAFNDAGSLTVYNAITAGGIITSTTGLFVAGSATAGSGVFGVTGAFAPYIGCNGTNNGCNLSFFTNGSGSSATAYITPGGTYTVGSSTYASTSATLNGPLQLTGNTAGNASYAGIWNDGSNGTIINSATGSSGVKFTTSGSTNGATVTTSGSFMSGTSTYGPTSASVAGNLNLTSSTSAITFSNSMTMNFNGNYSALELQSGVYTSTVQGISGADLLFTGSQSSVATPLLTLDNNGNIGLFGAMYAAGFNSSASGTATSGTNHYNSNPVKFNSSDWSGSAAVTNTGSFFMRDFGNPGSSYLFFSPPSGATIGGVGINSGSAIFAMLYGISSGVSGWIPGGTGGYAWYNNAQITAEMSLSDTGLLTLNQPLPVTSGGTGGAIGPGPALTAATAAINTTDTILATDPLGTASLAAGTTFDIKLFGTCTSSASNTSTFTIRFGTTGTTSDATVATLSLTSATSGTTVGFSLDTMLTIRTIGSSATSAAYGTLANGSTTGTGTGISVFSAGAAAFGTSAFNSSVTSGILSISYKSSATTTTTTFQNAIITVNHY